MTESTPSPKAIVRAFYESYNLKDLDTSFDTYVSTDLKNHAMGGGLDRAAWLNWDKGMFPAFPDFTSTVLDQIAEGDRVATRWKFTGTQQGEFSGVPAKGNFGVLTGTAIDRVENGKIVEHWVDLDFPSFVQALSA